VVEARQRTRSGVRREKFTKPMTVVLSGLGNVNVNIISLQ
jgi:hypothetical protein